MNKTHLMAVAVMAAGFAACAANFESKRPAPEKRLFRSASVDAKIDEVQRALGDTKLAWLFGNCFPNTLDTTVHY